jgi:PKD repeat protein
MLSVNNTATTRWLVVATLATVVLALPTAALADTYCVHQGPFQCSGLDEGGNLQAALTAAEGSPGPDSVFVGAGTYQGPFTYLNAEKLAIYGSGAHSTTLTAPAGAQETMKLTPPTDVGSNSISNVDVEVPATPSGAALEYAGVADDVLVTNPHNAADAVGVAMRGNSILEHSNVSVGSSSTALQGVGEAVHLADSSFSGSVGLMLEGGTVDASRIMVTATANGLVTVPGLPVVTTLRDSVVHVISPTSVGIWPGVNASVVADNVTVVGVPGAIGADIQAGGDGTAASLTLRDSIIWGASIGVTCGSTSPGGSTTVTLQRSDYPNALVSACTTKHDLGGNESVDPRFVDPTSTPLSPGTDFHLRWNSPVIDAGDPSAGSALDLDSLPRVVDGNGDGAARTDMGAYEYQRRPPVATAASSSSMAALGSAVSFSAAGSRDPDPGDVLTLAWGFDDGSSATGSTVSHAFSTAGAHTVTLTVTDPTGLSASATATVIVPGPASTKGTRPPATPAAPVDRIPPWIAGVRLTPRQFAVARGTTALSAGVRRGTIISFRLSEPAGVRLQMQRALTGRRFHGGCPAPARRLHHGARCTRYVTVGTLTRHGSAGANKVRFSGRIGRRALRASSYRLVITATDSAGNRSRAAPAPFTILTAAPRLTGRAR